MRLTPDEKECVRSAIDIVERWAKGPFLNPLTVQEALANYVWSWVAETSRDNMQECVAGVQLAAGSRANRLRLAAIKGLRARKLID